MGARQQRQNASARVQIEDGWEQVGMEQELICFGIDADGYGSDGKQRAFHLVD